MEKTSDLAAGWVDPRVRRWAPCLLFAALVSAGGYLRVPIPGNPVPLTLQVVFVLMAGAFLAPAASAVSVALFLGAGLAGAPVFAGGGAGAGWLLGPTGGYLLGFLVAAPLCSILVRGRRDSFARVGIAMLASIAAIHVLGAARLALYLGGDLQAALRFGVEPFLTLDLVKAALAAAVVTGTSSLFPKGSAGPA